MNLQQRGLLPLLTNDQDWRMAQAQFPGVPSSPAAPGEMPAGTGPAADTPQEMGFFDKFMQFGKDNGMQLAGIFNSLRYAPDPGISRMAMYDKQRKDQMELMNTRANKTAQWLEAQGETALADLVRNNPETGAMMLAQYAKGKYGKPSETFKQVKGTELGLTGDAGERLYNVSATSGKVDAVGGGGVNIKNEGNIPAGYQLVTGPDGTKSMQPIPGSPAAIEMAEQAKKAEKLHGQQSTAASTVVQDLSRMDTLLDDFMVGEGESWGGKVASATSAAALSQVPGTPEYQANQFKESALSNVGIDQLMQMKFNSPTGGALGQVPFQQQQRLEQLLGSLDLTLPKPALRDNVRRIQNIYLDVIHGTYGERKKLLDEGKITPEQFESINEQYKPLSFDRNGQPYPIDQSPDPATVPQELWMKYTPEQRTQIYYSMEKREGF